MSTKESSQKSSSARTRRRLDVGTLITMASTLLLVSVVPLLVAALIYLSLMTPTRKERLSSPSTTPRSTTKYLSGTHPVPGSDYNRAEP